LAQTIHILPEALASKIAAGEVVQRPASVVKELLENSIDAGATAVTVIIKDGGKSFIQVVDNGCGMSGEDAAVAFERHSTSKIASYEDLENIHTLGFRGEALGSISAVAQVELRTRQKDQLVGTRVRVEGSEVKETTQDALEPGTSITVRNLFYNTPGRRNFLKSNNTEFKHIFDVVQRVAITRPDFKIVFISDDDTALDLKPATRDERIEDLFGERQVEGLIAVEDSHEYISLSGYTSKPDYSRKTRVEQYLFLNGRYIVNRNLNYAVYQAYEHLLEKGSFPFFILFLTIDPRHVDVNVHPSKMEVKFEDERSVYRLVMNAVRKALLAQDLAPMVEQAKGRDQGAESGFIVPRVFGPTHQTDSWRELLRPEQVVDRQTGEIKTVEQSSSSVPPSPRQRPSDIRPPKDFGPQADFGGQAHPAFPTPHLNIWQIHNKYIVMPTHEGLMILDQHAAHERVLYEQIVERMNANIPSAQQILFSHTIELTPGDAALVKQLHSDLAAMGFVLKFFGKTTVVLEALPADIKPGKETTILQEIIDLFKENEHNVKLEPRENLAKSYSCKAAIKAGDAMNTEEMRSLFDQLFTTKNPFVCPHGRPVIVKLSLTELDKRFGRPV
jgi:DNA mismatch repair protein MutL